MNRLVDKKTERYMDVKEIDDRLTNLMPTIIVCLPANTNNTEMARLKLGFTYKFSVGVKGLKTFFFQ